MYEGTTVYKLDKLPTQPHYAVLYEDQIVTWSGYEEDRGSRETILRYMHFKSQEDLQKWIIDDKNNQYTKHKYRVIQVNPCQVDINVSVNVAINSGNR